MSMRMMYRAGCLFADEHAQESGELLHTPEKWLQPMGLDARALELGEELPQRLDLAGPQHRARLSARLASARRPHVATPASQRRSTAYLPFLGQRGFAQRSRTHTYPGSPLGSPSKTRQSFAPQ